LGLSATSEADISVVVATRDRATSLRSLLEALGQQTHTRFEVVVVPGPCTDHTAQVIEDFAERLKVVSCPEPNLSHARNLGIEASAGELIAFVDDDALPGAGWLSALAAGFGDDSGVAGVGGRVYDRDGFALQARFPACDRLGRVRLDRQAPLGPVLAGMDPLPYLYGTNQSYRRSALVALGGYDEAFRYVYDDADIALRAIDAGGRLVQVDGAPVIHARLGNETRDAEGAGTDPELLVEARAAFALRHGTPVHGERAALAELESYVEGVVDWARMMVADGRFGEQEYERYAAAARRGLASGIEAGRGARAASRLGASEPQPLLPYAGGSAAPGRLRVCFVSRDTPPDPAAPWRSDSGGVARYNQDLAEGFAEAGHEVHLITAAEADSSVSWESGMWVHRLAPNPRAALASARLGSPTIAVQLGRATAAWHEVNRILEFGPLDVVSAPVYQGEGLVLSLDARLPTVTTVHTPFRTVVAMHPSWAGRREVQEELTFERVAFSRVRHVHALTDAVLEEARAVGELDASERVLGLGVRDRLGGAASASGGDGAHILFVGRLERRKGVDVLLEAFELLHGSCPGARLTLVGQESEHTEQGETYRRAFERRAAANPSLASAVKFLGLVSDDRLTQLYSECDIVCAPSRYESFGLVAVEGMSFAKPVVACSTGGTVEVVRDGEDGLLVPPGDATALAGALRRLVEGGDLRERLGASARRRFETTFDLPVVVGRFAEAYRGVAREGSRVAAGETIEARLAEVIEELGLALGPDALAMAGALLDRDRHPVDWPLAVEVLADAGDDELIERLHVMLAGRPPSLSARARYGALLARSGRQELVRRMATSHEAVVRFGEPGWLGNLPPLPPPSLPRRLARTAARRAARAAFRASQRSGAYAIVIEMVRAQTRAVVAEAIKETRAERDRLSGAVARLEARIDELEAERNANGGGPPAA
jgi:glycogen(starch) synthase